MNQMEREKKEERPVNKEKEVKGGCRVSIGILLPEAGSCVDAFGDLAESHMA